MFCEILYAIIEVFTVLTVKIAIIHGVTPCSLVEVYPDVGGRRFIFYVGTLVPVYTASHTRRE
jgi:hypothetical protein